ncbi:MAG: BatA domain-containing protein, partial [Planctomycetaceae bacterium]
MTLLHPALLAGLALVAVPVVLHLLMKARPKPLVFPALRLLQERTQTTARR